MTHYIQRDYLLQIRDPTTNDVIDYCRSNTFNGVLNYLTFEHNTKRMLNDKKLIIEITRYEY